MAICTECSREIRGKARRERCRSCYHRLLREIKAQGTFASRVFVGEPGARVLAMSVPGPNACVVYTGWLDEQGYGHAKDGERSTTTAHRAAYEHLVGPIPAGLHLDHLCHNRDLGCPGGRACLHRRCVNPHHMEPVTPAENARRVRDRRVAEPGILCGNGHAVSPENTIYEVGRSGSRLARCKQCKKDRRRESARRKRSERRAELAIT